MRKRERENPCGICGHYHRYEEGEVCGVCGHRMAAATDAPLLPTSAFSSEIIKGFLYLGSYDNASRAELLKIQGITHILNTVPACQNLYKNSFTYYCLHDERGLEFDNAVRFLEQCERERARVLVHCMLGKNRSAAVVIAYLMISKGWRLPQSYQWLKERRPLVELSQAVYQQLVEYEQKIFGSNQLSLPIQSSDQTEGLPSFRFGLGWTTEEPQPPCFIQSTAQCANPGNLPCNFVFGATGNPQQKCVGNTHNINSIDGNGGTMDKS